METTGRRSDEIDGRATQTVFYAKDGRALAYTIVAGDRLERPSGAAAVSVEFRGVVVDGVPAVAWERAGRTCVLSGADVPADVILKLAA